MKDAAEAKEKKRKDKGTRIANLIISYPTIKRVAVSYKAVLTSKSDLNC